MLNINIKALYMQQ